MMELMDLRELVEVLRHAIHDLLITSDCRVCWEDPMCWPRFCKCDCHGQFRKARSDAQTALDLAADLVGTPPPKVTVVASNGNNGDGSSHSQ